MKLLTTPVAVCGHVSTECDPKVKYSQPCYALVNTRSRLSYGQFATLSGCTINCRWEQVQAPSPWSSLDLATGLFYPLQTQKTKPMPENATIPAHQSWLLQITFCFKTRTYVTQTERCTSITESNMTNNPVPWSLARCSWWIPTGSGSATPREANTSYRYASLAGIHLRQGLKIWRMTFWESFPWCIHWIK